MRTGGALTRTSGCAVNHCRDAGAHCRDGRGTPGWDGSPGLGIFGGGKRDLDFPLTLGHNTPTVTEILLVWNNGRCTMAKKTIADVNVKGKRVLMRVDFNVPQDDKGGITDDRRIRMALPSIQQVLKGGGRLILMSHLGRPEGKDPVADKQWTIKPCADRLGQLIGKPVIFAPDCVGPEVEKIVAGMKDGDCCLLENVRFHAAEQIKDKKAKDDPALKEKKEKFAKQLAALADVYVNDAFGTCHRDNASMLTVPQQIGRQAPRGRLPGEEGIGVPRRGAEQSEAPVRSHSGRQEGLGQDRGHRGAAQEVRHRADRRGQ